MKVLLLGAGASKCAGYPLTKDLMQAIGQEAIDSRALHLKDAWNKWKHLRETAPDRLSLMLNSPNPEICLSLLDLYELALAEQDPHKPSVYVETRNGLLECLRWFFAWKHAQGNTNELTREYLRSKLRSLSRGDVVITLNWTQPSNGLCWRRAAGHQRPDMGLGRGSALVSFATLCNLFPLILRRQK